MQGCDPGRLSPPVSRKQDMHLTVSTSSSSVAIKDQILAVWVQKVKKKVTGTEVFMVRIDVSSHLPNNIKKTSAK